MKQIFLSVIFICTLSIQAGHHEKADNAKLVVKQAYATFASGDTEAWAALHADDLIFTVFGDIPTSGKHVGPSAVIKNVFEPIAIHWPNFNIQHKAIYSRWKHCFCSL